METTELQNFQIYVNTLACDSSVWQKMKFKVI